MQTFRKDETMLRAGALCAVEENVEPERVPIGFPRPLEKSGIQKDARPDLDRFPVGEDEEIAGYAKDAIPDSVYRLSEKMMQESSLIRPLPVRIRQCIAQREKYFCFSLREKTPEEVQKILDLLHSMAGAAASVQYSTASASVKGEIVMTLRAQRFLKGQYLELGSEKVIREVLGELSEKTGLPYQVWRSVRIRNRSGRSASELDIVFCFGGIFCIAECKSGECFQSFGSLLETGTKFGIAPERLLLIDTGRAGTREAAADIEYFCGYPVSSGDKDSIREKVMAMTGRDFPFGSREEVEKS